MSIPVDTMNAIMRDISMDVGPSESKLKYSAEMITWRKGAEERWSAFKKKNPNARIEIPAGIEGLPGKEK